MDDTTDGSGCTDSRDHLLHVGIICCIGSEHWCSSTSVIYQFDNLALGRNTGMESMAALTNPLNREVTSHPEGKPSKETLDAIFQEY